MAISKDQILAKTHYGLNIYAFILSRFYPREVVLRTSGRECLPTKNPYNYDKPTLKIKVENGIAKHSDFEANFPNGDVFFFASRYYSLSGDALLKKINEDLHLKIKNPESAIKVIREPRIESPAFSFFKRPITNTRPTRSISLFEVYHLIQGSAYAKQTAQLSLLSEKAAIRKYKSRHFDYVTFSGIFSKRKNEQLLSTSCLMTIDIDNIIYVHELRQQLLEDEYFDSELLFISPSGKGLKWIIPYDPQKTNHAFYFNAVANYIRRTYKIKVDGSGKDISRACFLAHDPNCYINPKYI